MRRTHVRQSEATRYPLSQCSLVPLRSEVERQKLKHPESEHIKFLCSTCGKELTSEAKWKNCLCPFIIFCYNCPIIQGSTYGNSQARQRAQVSMLYMRKGIQPRRIHVRIVHFTLSHLVIITLLIRTRHMETHKPKSEQIKFLCSTCGKGFNRQYHLWELFVTLSYIVIIALLIRAEHMETHKPESERKFQCSTCGKGFTRQHHFWEILYRWTH